jgi:hypothetical protein
VRSWPSARTMEMTPGPWKRNSGGISSSSVGLAWTNLVSVCVWTYCPIVL